MHFPQVERKTALEYKVDITQSIFESKKDSVHRAGCCAATAPDSQEHFTGHRGHKHLRIQTC